MCRFTDAHKVVLDASAIGSGCCSALQFGYAVANKK
jgi:hypothetical protein